MKINNTFINNNNNGSNILNLENISIIHKGMLLFLLIISGNYIGGLVSCRTQYLLNNNIYYKHFIGFISLYFFIMLVELDINPIKSLILTVPMYFYFLMLTKSQSTFFISVIFILIILVFIQKYKSYLEKKTQLSKSELIFIKNVDLLRKIVIGIILILTIIGFLIYLGMKKVEYKNNFNLKNFLFGKIVCKNNFLGEQTTLRKTEINLARRFLNFKLIIYFLKKAFK